MNTPDMTVHDELEENASEIVVCCESLSRQRLDENLYLF